MPFAQKWDLKALGNWTVFREDANGNGSFTEAGDLNQTRTHNAANEITGITETGGQVAWADPTHDPKGNIATYPNPSSMTSSYAARYDAWNRLGRILGFDPVGDYIYDGLGRRITKKTYVGGSLDKTRQFFYSNSWQVIEERVDERTNDLERQYVWGIGYVDELVLRDRDTADDGTLDQRHYALQDANFSLTCIVDTNGDAAERYLYTPYGVRTCLDGSFANPSASGSYDWNIGHQGLMHDTESGLVYNRNRMLHPALGRFMQRDPLGYVDGQNLYEYVTGNPGTLTDAYGLDCPPGPNDKGEYKDTDKDGKDDRFVYDDPKFTGTGFTKICDLRTNTYFVIADNGDLVHKCPYPAADNVFKPGETGVAGEDGKSEKKDGAYTGTSGNKVLSERYWTHGVRYSYVDGKLRIVVFGERNIILADKTIDPPRSPGDFPNPEQVVESIRR